MMISQGQPLRFKISSWRQLVGCVSNNNCDLHIHVTDFYNNDILRGFRISVDHDSFGTVFACVLQARGTMITETAEYGESELSADSIIAELAKYGFLVTYAPNENLSSGQLEYLMTLKNLGYDKIRIINPWTSANGEKEFEPKVVAFQSSPLGDWLNNAYSPYIDEFTKALLDGTAVNLTYISKTKKYRWDWLKDFVGNIDDIIQDNADDMIRIEDPNSSEEDEEE